MNSIKLNAAEHSITRSFVAKDVRNIHNKKAIAKIIKETGFGKVNESLGAIFLGFFV